MVGFMDGSVLVFTTFEMNITWRSLKILQYREEPKRRPYPGKIAPTTTHVLHDYGWACFEICKINILFNTKEDSKFSIYNMVFSFCFGNTAKMHAMLGMIWFMKEDVAYQWMIWWNAVMAMRCPSLCLYCWYLVCHYLFLMYTCIFIYLFIHEMDTD